MSRIYLIILAGISFHIWRGWGFYNDLAVAFLPIAFFAPMIDWSPLRDRIKALNLKNLGLLVAFGSVTFSAVAPMIMYPEGPKTGDVIRVSQVLAGICLLIALVTQIQWKSRRFSPTAEKWTAGLLLLALVILGVSLVLVPQTSPRPYIDVWSYTHLAIEQLLAGNNPYEIAYPQMYENVQGHFPYLPSILYLLLPFKSLFGDVRYGLIAAFFASSLMIYSVQDKKLLVAERLVWPVLFMALSSNHFVVEQSWMDPLAVAALCGFLWAGFRASAARSNLDLFLAVVALSIFVTIKQYNLLFAPLLFFSLWSFREPKKWLPWALLAAVLVLLPMLPFLVWNAEALLDRVTHVPVMNRPIFMSLQTWFARRGLVLTNDFAFASTLLLAVAAFWYFLKKRGGISLALLLSFFLWIWLLTWYSNSAANYYWLAMVLLILTAIFPPGQPEQLNIRWLSLPLGLFLISRAIIVFGLAPHITDMGVYYNYSMRILVQGKTPYVDFIVEYPPLSLLSFLIPGALNQLSVDQNWVSFRFFFHALNFVIEMAFFRMLIKKLGTQNFVLYAYLTLTSIMAALLYDRIDLLLGILLVMPFLWRRYDGIWGRVLMSLWLGVGATFKLVPILLAPIYCLQINTSKFFHRLLYFLVALVPLAIAIGWVAWVDPVHEVSFLSYHFQRGVNVDSLYATAVLFWQEVLGNSLGISLTNNFGAFHLLGAGRLKAFSVAVHLVAMAVCAAWILWEWYKNRVRWELWVWTTILVFIISNRVLSPQFLIWLICLLAVLLPRLLPQRRWFFSSFFGSIVVLTMLHFHYYFDFIGLNKALIATIFLRNLLIVALIPLTFWAYDLKSKGEALAEELPEETM